MSKKGNRFNLVVLSISFIIISSSFFTIPVHSWEIDQTGTVYNIVDGDTVDVTSVGRIRLADIDCPEPSESGGPAASQYISSLIYQKEVYVDIDDITGKDPYDRWVAVIYVYYDDTRLKNVNKAMLVAGHAVIDNYHNNEFNPYSWTLYVSYQSNPPPDPPPPDDPSPTPNPSPPDYTTTYVGIGVGSSLIVASVITGTYAVKNKKKMKLKIRKVRNFFLKNSITAPKPQYTKTVSKVKNINHKGSNIQVKDIEENMRNINIRGKVEKVSEIRDFVRNDGSHGRVGSFSISDETGTIRVVVWDKNCSLLSQSNFAVGRQVKILDAYSKINTFYGKNEIEIHFGKFSRLEI
jgi:micrococcal nuclease